MDPNVGRIMDAVSELKYPDNTIVIFTSDNGPEDTMPWRGWAGPWSGTYVTAMEGSLRVPFIIRWPGKVPAERVSNQIVHITDLYTTLAKLGGADIPTDRAIDGVDQREFLLGKQEKSAREWFPVFQGDGGARAELYAMKWRNYKLHFVWQERECTTRRSGSPSRASSTSTTIPQERPEETTGESAVVTRGVGSARDVRGVGQAKGDPRERPADPDGDARSLSATHRRLVKSNTRTPRTRAAGLTPGSHAHSGYCCTNAWARQQARCLIL